MNDSAAPSRPTFCSVALGIQGLAVAITWAFLYLSDQGNSSEITWILLFALLNWQSAMIGMWAGLGQVGWRWPLVAVASRMTGHLANAAVDNATPGEFQIDTLGMIAIIAATSGRLRVQGPTRCCSTHLGIALIPAQLASPGSWNKEIVNRWSHWFAAIDTSAIFLRPGGSTYPLPVAVFWRPSSSRRSLSRL